MVHTEKIRDKIQRIHDNLKKLDQLASLDRTTFKDGPFYADAATRLLQTS